MIYTFNEAEVNFLKENLKEALKNINNVKGQVDIGNSLHMAYDLLMLNTGVLVGKTLQQTNPDAIKK